jgi:hypothetical protein
MSFESPVAPKPPNGHAELVSAPHALSLRRISKSETGQRNLVIWHPFTCMMGCRNKFGMTVASFFISGIQDSDRYQRNNKAINLKACNTKVVSTAMFNIFYIFNTNIVIG